MLCFSHVGLAFYVAVLEVVLVLLDEVGGWVEGMASLLVGIWL